MEICCMHDNYPINLILNNFIDTYLSTTFYIYFDLDYIILHWSESKNFI